MAAGDTITQSLADSLDTVVASARQIREYEGVMPNLVDKVTLSEGTGTSWREISMAALNAQNITETPPPLFFFNHYQAYVFLPWLLGPV